MSSSRDRDLSELARIVGTEQRFADDRVAVELVLNIVRRLKQMREERRLSQSELAKHLGITQGRVSQIESGLLDHAPNVEMIARYAAACGMRPEFTFVESEASAESDLAAA